MGLFDNLFLDQNTPVTINDGIDHSKDVADAITPPADPTNPYPQGTSSGGATGDGKKDPKDDKKDDTVSDLFVADKKDEIEAEAILHPKDEQDIALEIGRGPILSTGMPPADPTLFPQEIGGNVGDVVSFDIGGDISFDIGGDIVGGEQGLTTNISTPIPSPAIAIGHIESTPVAGSTVATPENTSTFISPVDVGLAGTVHPKTEGLATSVSLPESVGVPSSAVPTIGQAPQTPQTPQTPTSPSSESTIDSTLKVPPAPPVETATNVPSTISAPNLATITEAISSPETQATPTPVSSENSIFDLIGGSPGEPTESVKIDTSSSLESTEIIPAAAINSETPLGHLVSGASTLASPLREKLYSYVDELKGMQIHDQTHKSHKLNQIEVLEERIREIDQEALARKRVIRREIDMLYQEIASMEQDEQEIEGVVSSFEKGFETI